jgi:hypothetical protein
VLLLREQLYASYVIDASVGATDAPKRGTLVTMLAAETESVGSFAGSTILPRLPAAEPAIQHRLAPGD